ncbi:hypothetical protein GKQ38_00095 [Candidatus Nanohaloarchaea archaeon]|nr:hypothetical protein GKQ38_00095 [Candidatus Nanohaloarchaea archaeon]
MGKLRVFGIIGGTLLVGLFIAQLLISSATQQYTGYKTCNNTGQLTLGYKQIVAPGETFSYTSEEFAEIQVAAGPNIQVVALGESSRDRYSIPVSNAFIFKGNITLEKVNSILSKYNLEREQSYVSVFGKNMYDGEVISPLPQTVFRNRYSYVKSNLENSLKLPNKSFEDLSLEEKRSILKKFNSPGEVTLIPEIAAEEPHKWLRTKPSGRVGVLWTGNNERKVGVKVSGEEIQDWIDLYWPTGKETLQVNVYVNNEKIAEKQVEKKGYQLTYEKLKIRLEGFNRTEAVFRASEFKYPAPSTITYVETCR